jgi:two-component system cell cycle sensor histidine kinase/response regulator CckA
MAPDTQQRWLHDERVKLLTSMAPIAHVVTILNAGLVTLIHWRVIAPWVLLTWLTCILTITGLRFWLVRRDSPHWNAWFIMGAALSGIAWGSAAIVMFPLDSLVHQAFLAFVMGGMTAGAIPVLSPLLGAYVAYTLPVLLPITLRFLSWGDELHVTMGVMAGVYTVAMLLTARRVHQMVMTSFTLRSEKNVLIENLTAEIAERRRVEAEVRQAHDELDVRVKERTAELVKANSILCTEIYQRERIEKALREGQELLRLIMDNVVDLIAVLDLQGRRVYNNLAYQRLIGDPDALVGTDSFECVHPDDREHIKRMFFDTVETGVGQRAEYRFLGKDGGVRIVESLGNVIRDQEGAVVNVVVVSRDITERKHAEEKILQQAKLLDVARDAILVVNLDGRILFWNQGAVDLYGWTSEEIIEKHDEDILYVTLPPQWKEFNRTLREQDQWRGEMNHVTKRGNVVVVESHWTLVRDQAGTPTCILKVNSDITDKKLLEKRFLQTQRVESLGTLAGGIAHDINNVLTPMLVAAQLLLRMKSLDEESRQWVQGIEAAARRGAHLVRQVLLFARGVEGERVPLVVKYLVAELETMLKETFPRAIRIQILLPQDLWVIIGDFTQIYQVLLNLCVNARDAMPNGGSLQIEAANILVDQDFARRFSDASPGPHVSISVVDTGTGIPSHVMDKIFDPFFTTKETSKGTGLGLSTVLGIVKSHGGFVAVESKEGSGTRLTVYIPAEQALQSQSLNEPYPEVPRGHGELILLVDDEAGVLDLTRATLEAHGYVVLTAVDGMKAVDLYVRHHRQISVVVTDMMMPFMDGRTMMHSLQHLNPAVKLIAVSGLLENEHVSEWAGSTPIPFLPKPYTTENLLKLLQRVLKEEASNS